VEACGQPQFGRKMAAHALVFSFLFFGSRFFGLLGCFPFSSFAPLGPRWPGFIGAGLYLRSAGASALKRAGGNVGGHPYDFTWPNWFMGYSYTMYARERRPSARPTVFLCCHGWAMGLAERKAGGQLSFREETSCSIVSAGPFGGTGKGRIDSCELLLVEIYCAQRMTHKCNLISRAVSSAGN